MATEQEIMDELLASYGGNEMRAFTPGPFEQQEQTIESFLSGIGQFAEEKDVPFLRALADPSYARNVAGNLSFGTEMTPGVGDVQAIREGAFMMGEGQPKMGAAFIAGSIFTGMSSSQLKKALEKLKKELNEKIPALKARSQSYWKEWNQTGSKGDYYDAEKLQRQVDRSETRIKQEIGEAEELLKQQELRLQVESFDEMLEGFEKFKKESSSMIPKKYRSKEKLATVSDINVERLFKKLKDEKTPEPETVYGIASLFDDPNDVYWKKYQAAVRKAKERTGKKTSGLGNYQDWVKQQQDLAQRNARETIERFSLEDIDDLSPEEMKELIKKLSRHDF